MLPWWGTEHAGPSAFRRIVEGAVKIQLYQHCCFFVCPSRRELSPQSIWKRWQPVNRSWRPRGWYLEVVSEGGNGFLVPPDDPEALATSMLTLSKIGPACDYGHASSALADATTGR